MRLAPADSTIDAPNPGTISWGATAAAALVAAVAAFLLSGSGAVVHFALYPDRALVGLAALSPVIVALTVWADRQGRHVLARVAAVVVVGATIAEVVGPRFFVDNHEWFGYIWHPISVGLSTVAVTTIIAIFLHRSHRFVVFAAALLVGGLTLLTGLESWAR